MSTCQNDAYTTSRTAIGMSATDGIGRRNSMVEAVNSRVNRELPIRMPRTMPATLAIARQSAQRESVSRTACQKEACPTRSASDDPISDDVGKNSRGRTPIRGRISTSATRASSPISPSTAEGIDRRRGARRRASVSLTGAADPGLTTAGLPLMRDRPTRSVRTTSSPRSPPLRSGAHPPPPDPDAGSTSGRSCGRLGGPAHPVSSAGRSCLCRGVRFANVCLHSERWQVIAVTSTASWHCAGREEGTPDGRRWRGRGRRTGAGQQLRAVPRPRPRRHPRLRRRAPPTAAQRGRPRDRAHPGGGPPVPPDAGAARLRAGRRAGVLAPPAGAGARLLVPVGAHAPGGGAAAPRVAGRPGGRVVVGLGPRRRRRRLRGPGAHQADHDRDDHRRHPLPGVRDVDGPRAPRRAARGGARRLPGAGGPGAAHVADGDRCGDSGGTAGPRAQPGLRAGRPGAGGGAALGGRADPQPGGCGGGGGEPVGERQPHVAAPAGGGVRAAAARDGRPDLPRPRSPRLGVTTTRPSRWTVAAPAAVLVITALCLRGPFAAVGPVLDEVGEELSVSTSALAVVTSLPLVCFGLLSPFAPALAARIGLHRAVLAGTAVLAAGIALRSVGTVGLFVGTVVLCGGGPLPPPLLAPPAPGGV